MILIGWGCDKPRSRNSQINHKSNQKSEKPKKKSKNEPRKVSGPTRFIPNQCGSGTASKPSGSDPDVFENK